MVIFAGVRVAESWSALNIVGAIVVLVAFIAVLTLAIRWYLSRP